MTVAAQHLQTANPKAADLRPRRVRKQVLKLALPALGTLIAQPLLTLIDTIMIGHLGSNQLAGVTIATTVLTTFVGLMVFLAYATTGKIARFFGAGQLRQAVQVGIDGLYLAFGIGIISFLTLLFCGSIVINSFAQLNSDTGIYALSYLNIAVFGVPAILLSFAATGLERGFQNTVAPLIITVFGCAFNAILNATFIYLCGMGVTGSALGTVIAEWLIALIFATRIYVKSRIYNLKFLPTGAGVLRHGVSGGWLFLRTLCLRGAILLTVWVATLHSSTVTAALATINAVFMLLAFALDALAIAAQALIGKTLGAKENHYTRTLLRQLLQMAAIFGFILGTLLAASSPVLGNIFTADSQLLKILPAAFLVLAVTQPLAAIVFTLDGVLMGAADNRYLALTGVLNFVCYAPLPLFLSAYGQLPANVYLVLLTIGFFVWYLTMRLLTLSIRARGTAWMR